MSDMKEALWKIGCVMPLHYISASEYFFQPPLMHCHIMCFHEQTHLLLTYLTAVIKYMRKIKLNEEGFSLTRGLRVSPS